jgi:hypothetical protein
MRPSELVGIGEVVDALRRSSGQEGVRRHIILSKERSRHDFRVISYANQVFMRIVLELVLHSPALKAASDNYVLYCFISGVHTSCVVEQVLYPVPTLVAEHSATGVYRPH